MHPNPTFPNPTQINATRPGGRPVASSCVLTRTPTTTTKGTKRVPSDYFAREGGVYHVPVLAMRASEATRAAKSGEQRPGCPAEPSGQGLSGEEGDKGVVRGAPAEASRDAAGETTLLHILMKTLINRDVPKRNTTARPSAPRWCTGRAFTKSHREHQRVTGGIERASLG